MATTVMTLGEVAEFLRVHPSTIYRLLRLGHIPAFKLGSDWRFRRESIEHWLIEQESFGDDHELAPEKVESGALANQERQAWSKRRPASS